MAHKPAFRWLSLAIAALPMVVLTMGTIVVPPLAREPAVAVSFLHTLISEFASFVGSFTRTAGHFCRCAPLRSSRLKFVGKTRQSPVPPKSFPGYFCRLVRPTCLRACALFPHGLLADGVWGWGGRFMVVAFCRKHGAAMFALNAHADDTHWRG